MGEPIPEGELPKARRRRFDVEDIVYQGDEAQLCGARCHHKLYDMGVLHECMMSSRHEIFVQQHMCNCGRIWGTGISFNHRQSDYERPR